MSATPPLQFVLDSVDLSFIQSLCEGSTFALLMRALERSGDICAVSFVGVFGFVLACLHLRTMKQMLASARKHAQSGGADALARLIARGGGLVSVGFVGAPTDADATVNSARGGGNGGANGPGAMSVVLSTPARETGALARGEGDALSRVSTDELRALRAKAATVFAEGALEREGWELIMDRCTDGMRYRAWRRDTPSGLTEYRSSTLIRGVSPEEMNELYLDDENRPTWDIFFRGHDVLEEAGSDGGVVRWHRKFPVCPPRDYVLARRCIVVDGDVCTMTRSCEHPGAPPREKPHRVDRFYSSWVCRAVPWVSSDSTDGDSYSSDGASDDASDNGRSSDDGDAADNRDGGHEHGEASGSPATETVLVHCEDLGIPRDLAKFVIRQGMWRMVRKIERAVRAYASERAARGHVPRPGITSVCVHPAEISSELLDRPACDDDDIDDAAHVRVHGGGFGKPGTYGRGTARGRSGRRLCAALLVAVGAAASLATLKKARAR